MDAREIIRPGGGDSLVWLAGEAPEAPRPRPPFAPEALGFLADLSSALRGGPASRGLGDVQSFAFWCRRANLDRLAETHASERARLGRGLLFHVAPANVPVTFAYSFAFGLLAGNANIVRVPSRESATVSAICDAIARLLERAEHRPMAGSLCFVRYPRESGWTASFSARCDGRIIWGGDATILEIRKAPLPPHAVEVAFPDRTSLAVMHAAAVLALDAAGLARLAAHFYNDTFAMDQNACSSPHLVVWLGDRADVPAAAGRFWAALGAHADERYRLAPVQAVERHTRLLRALMEEAEIESLRRYGTCVSVMRLRELPPACEALRGRYGLFWEFHAPSLDAVAPQITRKFQTLSQFGCDGARLRAFVIENRLPGIDRIVPIGKALELGPIWDGFDLIAQLSRIVAVE